MLPALKATPLGRFASGRIVTYCRVQCETSVPGIQHNVIDAGYLQFCSARSDIKPKTQRLVLICIIAYAGNSRDFLPINITYKGHGLG